MDKKIAAGIGMLVGGALGALVASSMLREHNKCQFLVKENQMLKEIIMMNAEKNYDPNY